MLLWRHFSVNAALSKWAWCDDVSLDHMKSKKSANPALFSLLLTPDLLLKNIVSSIALPLMMCNHMGFLHNVFNVGRDHKASLISRDTLGRWWYAASLNIEHTFTPQKQTIECFHVWNRKRMNFPNFLLILFYTACWKSWMTW